MDFQLIFSEWEDFDGGGVEADIPESEKNMNKDIELEMSIADERKLICL